MVVAFSVFGIILFIAGVVFLFRAYFSIPDPQSIVPRAQLETAERNLILAKDSEKKTKTELTVLSGELEAVRESLELTSKAEQEARAVVDDLESKSRARITEAQALAEQLKAEKEADQQKIQHLESEIAAITAKMTEQAQGALGLIESLKGQVKDLQEKKGGAASAPAMASDNGELAKLKELNAQLTERERMAQLELAKNRTQTAGLEKICEDFKTKLEGMEKIKDELREAEAKLDILQKENTALKKG
ncbi:MAG TPA: hypothetical protein PL155_06970 [Candidatus Omnitrophota bacterium]|nr:hypothetical protein [Candidatus Omnitrophota bacterium]HPD85549.1 hypothetical protein [Candidatus Omnitrophota bacterium]HRZ04411.1 hypothetical protein [Candidatus Omnitrophota bacterium]